MVDALKLARVWLPVAILAAIACVSLACGGQEPPVEAPDPSALLAQTASNLRAVQSVEFRLTHETGSLYLPDYSAKITDISGTWDAEAGAEFTVDAYLVTGPETDVQSGSYVQLSAVATPQGYFVTEPISGLWLKQPASAAPIEAAGLQHRMADLVEAVEDPVFESKETLDGVAVYQISGVAPASTMDWLPVVPSEGQTLRIDVWTGVDQQLLRRIDLAGAIDEFDAAETLRTISLSKFGEPVDVTPPEQFLDLSGG